MSLGSSSSIGWKCVEVLRLGNNDGEMGRVSSSEMGTKPIGRTKHLLTLETEGRKAALFWKTYLSSVVPH